MNCTGEQWKPRNASSCYFSTINDIINIREDNTLLGRIAYKYVLPVIIIIGILGNSLNLLVLCKPFLKGATKVYLTALAFTDLGVMLAALPMVIRLNKLQGSSYATTFFYAHLEIPILSMFLSSSIFIIVCVTVNRYLAAAFPGAYLNVNKKSYARLAILGSYTLGIVLNAPLILLKNVCLVAKENDTRIWDFHENLAVTLTLNWRIYLLFCEILSKLIPGVILAVLNMLIIRVFRKKFYLKKKLQIGLGNLKTDRITRDSKVLTPKSKRAQEEHRVVILLHAIVCLFFICITPSMVLSLTYSEQRESYFAFQLFRTIANNLEMANFALNFYVYCMCSEEFRVALKNCVRKMLKI